MRQVLLKLVIASSLCFNSAPSWPGPIIRVGEAPDVAVGSVFTIPIFVTHAIDLMAFQFDLSYDSTILKALDFTDVGTDFETAATAGGGVLTGITGFLSPGLLSGVADSMSGALSGLSGTGSVVNIQFQALYAGRSALTLSSVFLDYSELDDGSIVNGSVAVPAPGTLALLTLGLVLLRMRQTRKGD